jgi:transglutaminase-like putative cysteine protease
MVYRNSWLAGLAAIGFAVAQLNTLILPTREGVLWQYIVIAAAALGLIITWTALTYRLKTWIVILLNAGVALIAVVRVATPETTAFFLPTSESFSRLREQLGSAQHLIREGIEPVIPDAGVVVVMMVVLWTVGALMAWGLLRGHPYIALLPPLVLSLQFATMNRAPTSGITIAAFISLVAVIIFAITADDRDHTSGRMAPRGQWASHRNRPGPAAAALLGITVIGSVFLVRAVDDAVPYDGILDWRIDSGLPSDVYGGSVSYNAFIGIRQRLVTGSPTPVFLANIRSDVPLDEVYFRFMTLENYDGSKFSVSQGDLLDLDDPVWQSPGHQFAGPTEPLATIVAIDQLDMEWLPTPAVPIAVAAIGDRFGPYLRVRPQDAAILYDGGRTYRKMTYRVDALVPRPNIDVLATNQSTGELSISFQAALQDQDLPAQLVPEPTVVAEPRPEPPDPETFLDLPTDPTARIAEIRALSRRQTSGLETEFEMGLALETYLRTFDYTTNIESGHGADDLAAWLLDTESPNFHAGYCENFSTAMAVMARTLGIHSRVVLGFTPGERSLLEPKTVIVRDRNAHAWVELWMPSQGWVRFDPTPRPDPINPSTGRLIEEQLDYDPRNYLDVELPEPTSGGDGFVPPLDRPIPTFFVPSRGGEALPTTTGLTVPAWVRWVAPPVGLILMIAAGIPALKAWRHRRRLHRLHHGDITAAWEDIVVRLGDLGHPLNPARTPIEIAAGVDDAMVPLAIIYGKAVYGRPNGSIEPDDIAIAEASLLDTRDRLISNSTRRRRIVASYRPGAVRKFRRRGSR